MKYYLDDLENKLENKKLIIFVEWYLNGADETEWENVRKKLNIKMDMQKALDTYLKRLDVQQVIVEASKVTKDFNFIQVYRNMLKKALDGDQKSADWILKANSSDFFKEKEQDKEKEQLENIIKGLNLDE